MKKEGVTGGGWAGVSGTAHDFLIGIVPSDNISNPNPHTQKPSFMLGFPILNGCPDSMEFESHNKLKIQHI